MSKSSLFLSARRAAFGSAIGVLLCATTAVPAAAWRVADHASTTVAAVGPRVARTNVSGTTGAPGAGPAGAPVGSRDEALAAGGRRAPGGKAHTVIRFGIDVSHWQGQVDWDRVARSGRVQFVVAKATEGTWMVDPTYQRNRTLAQQAGLLFTAYHYANPSRKPGDARREADFFLAHADLKGINLLPALDLEDAGDLSPRELERWTFQWVRRVEHRLGVAPMVYTSPGFWSAWVGDSPDLSRAGYTTLWLSHWEVRRPWIPARGWAGAGWTFWQWTERGTVAGITGSVDRDVYSGPKLRHMTIRELRRERAPGSDPRAQRPPRPEPRSAPG